MIQEIYHKYYNLPFYSFSDNDIAWAKNWKKIFDEQIYDERSDKLLRDKYAMLLIHLDYTAEPELFKMVQLKHGVDSVRSQMINWARNISDSIENRTLIVHEDRDLVLQNILQEILTYQDNLKNTSKANTNNLPPFDEEEPL